MGSLRPRTSDAFGRSFILCKTFLFGDGEAACPGWTFTGLVSGVHGHRSILGGRESLVFSATLDVMSERKGRDVVLVVYVCTVPGWVSACLVCLHSV